MEPPKPLSISAHRASPRPVLGLLTLALLLNASVAGATPSSAAAPTMVAWVPTGFSPPLPADGALAFSYAQSPGVTGCSQSTEAEIRELLIATVHGDPFVPAGQPPTFTLRVEVSRPAPDLFRATLSLFDAKGGPRGVSLVEDETCDGAHLKLLSSIALLLQPRPDPPCDAACRTRIESDARERIRKELREKELPRLREAARIAVQRAIEARRTFRAVLGAGPVAGFDLAAEPGAGFWLSAEARSERWSVGLEMRAMLPARTFDLAGGAALDQASATGLVVPCLRLRWLAGCALVEAGGVFVLGPGTAAGSGASSGLLGFGLRVRVDVPIAAGFEVRFFGDVVGYPVVLEAQAAPSGGGAAAFDAPRRVAAFAGLGLVRAFE